MPATETDPYDWAGIAASSGDFMPLLDRIKRENPAATLKQILDIFRSMTGGQLPPGISPTLAYLLDSGIATDAVQTNPAMLQMMETIAAQRAQTQQDYMAAKNTVGQNYQNLTGQVEQQGTQWMADLLQRMGVNPVAAQYDPNITGYGETIANMGATADQNQATDQAWFDKMAAVSDQSSLALLQSLAQQAAIPIAPVEESGGGGGGRGRGGGGSGNDGSSGWTDPKTTDTVNQAADSFSNYYNPGFQDTVLGGFDDPASAEYAQQLLDVYGGSARDVGSGIVKNDLPRLTTAIDTALAQQAQERLYRDTLPTRTSETAANFTALPEDQLLALDPTAQAAYGRKEEIAGLFDEITNWGTRPENQGAAIAGKSPGIQAILQAVSRMPGMGEAPPVARNNWFSAAEERTLGKPKVGTAEYFEFLRRKHGPDVEGFNSEYLRDLAIGKQKEHDIAEFQQARQNATTSNPFTYEGWTGYVEPIDREALKENQWAKGIVEQVLGVARDYNPNYDWQTTRLSQQDSSDTKTTQSSKDPANQIFNNNVDPAAPVEMGTSSDQSGAYEGFNGFGAFGQSKGMLLSEAGQRVVQNRLRAAREKQAAEDAAAKLSGFANFGREKKAPAKPKTKASSVLTSGAVGAVSPAPTIFDQKKKPREIIPKRPVKKSSVRSNNRAV